MSVMARVRALAKHPLGIVVATLLWCLLWGGFTWLTVIGGILISAAVYILFPMPALSREVTVRPWPALVFLAVFAKDIATSSIEVARYALRPSGSPGSSVIAVTLASRSDLFLTLTGVLGTLIPGSVVVEAQRSTGTLFFHAIGVTNDEEADAMRRQLLAQEKRALRAFASSAVLADAGLISTNSSSTAEREGERS